MNSSSRTKKCLGPLARTAVDALEVTMYGQVPLDAPVANFAITPLPIELRVSGKPTTDVVFELAGFDSGGNEITLLQQTATLVNTMLNAASSQAFAAVATKYTTVYQTTGGGDATIMRRSTEFGPLDVPPPPPPPTLSSR